MKEITLTLTKKEFELIHAVIYQETEDIKHPKRHALVRLEKKLKNLRKEK